MKKVNVLGTEYAIEYHGKEDKTLNDADGYTDFYSKKIVVANLDGWKEEEPDRNHDVYINKVLRHEIIHAFLYESGLAHNSQGIDSWAMNEEMVDWIAIMHPKLQKAFKEVCCHDR